VSLGAPASGQVGLYPTHAGEHKLRMLSSRPEEFGDEELVISAQQGERQAFEVLVERYKQKAYRIAFDFTRDREEAKDLSQEAFLQAFSHLKGFDRRASFYTWFYRILVNLCLDYRRRKTKIAWESLDEKTEKGDGFQKIANPGPSPDQEVMRQQVSQRIGAALATLPPKQRAVFLLKNHQGLSIREIADVMKSAEGTIKVHLHRAVIALRQRLAELS
jgi:RNA polymerase sigma-70 factor, ECF subfamily